MDTVLRSRSASVTIGAGQPFCVIGERINPTGRKLLAAEMAAGDFTRVTSDTLAQVAAGAHMLDVNAGIPMTDEPKILADTIKLVQSLTDLPLSIDSSIVAALEAGLAAYVGRPLLNSVTGEEERLEVILPLVSPGIAATALICVIFAWNEFFLAVNLTAVNAQTMPVYLVGFIAGEGQYWAVLSAAATMAALPVMLCGWFAQNKLVRGLSFGAIK